MNTRLQNLLGQYSQSHQNIQNRRIHKVAVPLIMFSLLGLLSIISMGPIHLAWVLIAFALLYYAQFKEWKVYLIVLLQVIPMMILIQLNPWPALPVYLAIFILAWIAQFIGHKIEGQRPSFLQDLQFLLIGPVWICKDLAWKKNL